MSRTAKNSFSTAQTLKCKAGTYNYYSLKKLSDQGFSAISRLPFTIKVLLEGVLRGENGKEVTSADVEKLARYQAKKPDKVEIPYLPARVLLQDFTGVPAMVDLAAMRDAIKRLGGDPNRINPQVPADLVIDHSVQIDVFGSKEAFNENARIEFERNHERYQFLKWGAEAFDNFSVVPPASGICHQVNLEYLGKVVQNRTYNGEKFPTAYPDTLVGTDSHTPMINGLGVLGWGVGGIEAEAVLLGQPYYMMLPEVVGFKLKGSLPEGATATDLVLTVTQILRAKGVVGKFVEYFGSGLSSMSLPDRATLANMAPEYGATCGFFPVDTETLRYLKRTGRDEALVDLVECYCKEQGLFRSDDTPDPHYIDTVELDLSTVKPCVAGPKRPQDRIELAQMKSQWHTTLKAPINERGFGLEEKAVSATGTVAYPDGGKDEIKHGAIVIASITSCTNTSNPSVMLAAGILAKKAVEAGLKVKGYVKTSLAPGSKVVTEYYDQTGLTPFLEKLGFYNVGYGCMTCIGNSGPLPAHVSQAIRENGLIAASALSGNRNFEGRIHGETKANFLASPPLVVAYALAGTVDIDFANQPLGKNEKGEKIFLKDIWPSDGEMKQYLEKATDAATFRKVYREIRSGNEEWNKVPVEKSPLYNWSEKSTYIQEPPFFQQLSTETPTIKAISGARPLVLVGDSLTTDHISPAGAIPADGPAGKYLIGLGVKPEGFNSFGSRRGNDRVMTRGTFANIRLKNRLAPGTEGGFTKRFPDGEVTSIYEAAMQYQKQQVPTVVIGGKDYGMGSSRDWAAKGTYLLGARAVLAESFERIHRSNLIGMGVLPLQFKAGENAERLSLGGEHVFDIAIDQQLKAGQEVTVTLTDAAGKKRTFNMLCRLDTPIEVEYYRNGGILHKVLRDMLAH